MENNSQFSIDRFFTDTRIYNCFATSCVYNIKGKCKLKYVSIGDTGNCKSFYEKKKNVRTN